MAERNFNTIFGENMRRERLRRGMTLTDVADGIAVLGYEPVTNNTVGGWERGYRSISLEYAVAVCRVLETSYKRMLGELDPRFENISTEERIAMIYDAK